MIEGDLPTGLEKVFDNIRVNSTFRHSVEFDDILPGDVLIYRGNDMRYYFVYGRSRDHIHGWHFGGPKEQGSGGWGHLYRDFVANNAKVDRIAPILVPSILEFYQVQAALKALQTGDCKVE